MPAGPRVGDIFVLPEDDYRYGLGPVIARIVRVVGPVDYRDEPWWAVEADVADGTPDNHCGWSPRSLYVRESTLAANRRASPAR